MNALASFLLEHVSEDGRVEEEEEFATELKALFTKYHWKCKTFEEEGFSVRNQGVTVQTPRGSFQLTIVHDGPPTAAMSS